MLDEEGLRWVRYFDRLDPYQKLVIVSAMLGAIEGLQNISLTDEAIIDYFEQIIFREQMLTRRVEP